jgi:hypothetical protein
MGGPTPSILMPDISSFDQPSTWVYHARRFVVPSAPASFSETPTRHQRGLIEYTYSSRECGTLLYGCECDQCHADDDEHGHTRKFLT